MNRPIRLTATTLLVCVLAIVLGCDSGVAKTKVTGKLLMKGKPLDVSKKTQVMLKFAPDVEKPTQTYSASFKHDTGQYEVELPPGKYTVRCHMVDENMKKIPSAPAKVYDLSNVQVMDFDVTPE